MKNNKKLQYIIETIIEFTLTGLFLYAILLIAFNNLEDKAKHCDQELGRQCSYYEIAKGGKR